MTQVKRNATDVKERIDLLKIKLRKQVIEAQKLVDKANETGDFKKAVEIQEKNVKVMTLLGITAEDLRSRSRNPYEKQNTFIT